MRGRNTKDAGYFAEWLTRTLNERDISGGEVAKALGVNDSAVSRWKNGKALPGLDSVMALATYLEVHPIGLAVTAGLMEAKSVGVQALPLPEDTKTRDRVREQIMNIRGLTTSERQALIEAYEMAKG